VEVSRSGEFVSAEVIDDGGTETVSQMTPVGKTGTSGRGLFLVEFLSDRWGTEDGTRVMECGLRSLLWLTWMDVPSRPSEVLPVEQPRQSWGEPSKAAECGN